MRFHLLIVLSILAIIGVCLAFYFEEKNSQKPYVPRDSDWFRYGDLLPTSRQMEEFKAKTEPDCTAKGRRLAYQSIDQYKHCDADSDCMFVQGNMIICGGVAVNKSEAEKAVQILNECPRSNEILAQCLSLADIKTGCVNNQCSI